MRNQTFRVRDVRASSRGTLNASAKYLHEVVVSAAKRYTFMVCFGRGPWWRKNMKVWERTGQALEIGVVKTHDHSVPAKHRSLRYTEV
jgi:hypothetical protein